MAVIQDPITADQITVDPTYKAMHVAGRPAEITGAYRHQVRTGITVASTAAGILYAWRYIGPGIAIVHSVRLGLNVIAAYTQGNITYGMYYVRNYTTTETTGGTLMIAGSNGKQRTAMADSLVQIFVATTANITAIASPANIEDPQPIGAAIFNLPAAITGQPVQDLLLNSWYSYSPKFTANQGFHIKSDTAYAATGTSQLQISVEWTELTSGAATSF